MEKRIVPPAERFKAITEDILEYVEGILGTTVSLNMKYFYVASAFALTMDKAELSSLFIYQTWRYWPKIKEKNVAYFREHGLSLVSERFHKRLKPYLGVVFSGQIKGSDMEEFWERSFSLVRCSLHYLYENTEKIPAGLSLEKLSKEWEITLGTVVYSEGEESEVSTSGSEDAESANTSGNEDEFEENEVSSS